MQLSGWKRRLVVAGLLGLLLASSCSVGAGAGIGSGVLTILLALLLAGGTSTTQTACFQPCLSVAQPDTFGVPDDADADTGDATDGGRPDTLDVEKPDALDADQPDAVDADRPDAGDTGGEALQPCLAPPAPDAETDSTGGDVHPDGSGETDTMGARAPDRREVIDRLEDRLPDDVVERLSDEAESA